MSFVPPGWDEWVGLMKEGYYRFSVNDNGAIEDFYTKKRKARSSLSQGDDDYSTDLFAAKAADFITHTISAGRPFFLYLAPYAIHGPAEPPQRYAGTFAGATSPRSPAFNEADISDKPGALEIPPVLSPSKITEIDERYARRLETLQAVDEMVAMLFDHLQAHGASEQTYIVLSSDNGYHLGEHRLAEEKGSPYEEAIRLPLVVRGPGVPAGETIWELTSQVDLAPTFAAWGDAPVPEFVDGRSLAPLLTSEGTVTTWRQAALIEHSAHGELRGDGTPAISSFQAMRSEQSLYVEYSSGEQELYDLKDDPYELDNLIDRTDPGLVAALSERLAAMSDCAGEVCRTIEDTPLPAELTTRITVPAAMDA
jgi:arylsulfatase A-like enzyme